MTDLLQRRPVCSPRRERRVLALAILAVLAASGLWYAIRRPLAFALARSGVGCPGREPFIGAVLPLLYPDLTDGKTAFIWGSSVLRRGRVVIWQSTAPTNSSDVRRHLADRDLHYLGSIRTTAMIYPCPNGYGDDDGVTLGVIYTAYRELGNSTQSAPACGIVRLRQHRAEVAGVLTGPGVGATWKDTDNDGAPEITFWRVVRGAAPRFQVVAAVKLDRDSVPLRDSLPSDGSILAWTPPDGIPVPIPDGVEATEFFQQLLPLPPTFGTFTPNATTSTAPTTTRSTSP